MEAILPIFSDDVNLTTCVSVLPSCHASAMLSGTSNRGTMFISIRRHTPAGIRQYLQGAPEAVERHESLTSCREVAPRGRHSFKGICTHSTTHPGLLQL